MAIDPVTQLQNATFQPGGGNFGELSSVDFMQLIVAQMRNQNPLSPQDNNDFMAQLAQFESLNQMTQLAQGIRVMQSLNELSSASAMIGHEVVGRQVDGLAIVQDVVSRELFGQSYAALSVQQREDVADDPRVLQAIQDQVNVGAEVSGVVDRVVVGADGIPMLFVDGRVVDLFTVSEVS